VPYLQGIPESLRAIKALVDFYRGDAAVLNAAPIHIDEGRRDKARLYLAKSDGQMTEDVAKSLLRLYGFPVVRERMVRSAAAGAHAANEIGYPVAAKILSAEIPHKAAVGGVRLDLASATEVRDAVDSLSRDVRQRLPKVRIDGFVIQSMVRKGVEIILGMKRDAQFGNTVLIGLGGVFVEALRQFAMRLAPISYEDACAMINEVPALADVLQKVAPGYDPKPVLAPLLVKLSNLAQELGDRIDEIDMNPIILDPGKNEATVVDALIVHTPQSAR
jgi:acyl-CoA synthetase (NDP forming)